MGSGVQKHYYRSGLFQVLSDILFNIIRVTGSLAVSMLGYYFQGNIRQRFFGFVPVTDHSGQNVFTSVCLRLVSRLKTAGPNL